MLVDKDDEKVFLVENEKKWNSGEDLVREKKFFMSLLNVLKELFFSEESSVFFCKWVGCDGFYLE